MIVKIFKDFTKYILFIVGITLLSISVVQAKTLLLGMSAALTGPAKDLGQGMKLGIESYLNHVNQTGGIAGNKLKLVALDDRYEPYLTKRNMLKLARNKNILAIVGNVGTPTAVVSVPIANSEIKPLMNDLEQVSKNPEITQAPGFVFVLNNIVTILQKFGYSGFLDQIEQMFPKVVLQSRDINAKFISYYDRKVLGATNIANITQSNHYQLFTKHVQIAETGNVEEDALPLQILVQFHIAGDLRNPNTDKLLRSVANLPVREQAVVLWEIMRNSNPRFWQKNPSPSDFRISKTVNKFIMAYQTKLHVLAQTSGVKKTILEFYQNANTIEDQKLGKEIVYFFYKITVSLGELKPTLA